MRRTAHATPSWSASACASTQESSPPLAATSTCWPVSSRRTAARSSSRASAERLCWSPAVRRRRARAEDPMADSRSDIERILALDRDHVIHPIHELAKHEKRGAKLFTGGHGVELELADGRRVLDGFSGLFNINVGHGRREI